MFWWSADVKKIRVVILSDMFFNASFKITTSFVNVARITAMLMLVSVLLLKCTSFRLVIHYLNLVRLFHL